MSKSIRLPPDLIEMIAAHMEANGMNRADLLRAVLQHWADCSLRPDKIQNLLTKQRQEWRP